MELVTPDLEGILRDHYRRYQAMQVEDIYKLILQGTCGSEHAVQDPQRAREWLEEELATMGSGRDEPRVDPISSDGRFVRLHLRPFIGAGGKPEALLAAFIASSRPSPENPLRMQENLCIARRVCAAEPFAIEAHLLDKYFSQMESLGFPAVHHSRDYRRFYRPAYRVVAADLLEELI